MTAALLADLERYCLIPALAGHEGAAVRAFHADLAPHVDRISVDRLGNVIGTINGSGSGESSVMVFAHLDQLGMIVQRITAEGFIRVVRVGGLPERVLAGQVVHILTPVGPVPGVVGTIAHHLTPPEARYVVRPIEQVAIDVGAASAEQARTVGIEVGQPVVYEPRFTRLASGRVTGTSIDDRGGIAVLLGVARSLHQRRPEWTVHLVGSVQEEFNLRGAVVAAQELQPHLAISLDIVAATDAPDTTGHSDIRLGAGPVMGTYTFHGRGTLNGLIPDPRLVERAARCAAERGLPLQRHATVGLLTETSYIQLIGRGVAALDLGWPTRYTHSPVETCEIADLVGLQHLVEAVLWSLSGPWPQSRFDLSAP